MGRQPGSGTFYEGIDLLRAGAVFLVLWSHGGQLVPEHWRPFLFSEFVRPGFWGVTIFFAISGFLIVGQLLDILSGHREESLRVFVLRRWLRTVPTYWLVLALFTLGGAVAWPGLPLLFGNLLFLQGWVPQIEVLLPVSWSLVIEEWSYLFFASLAALLAFSRRQWGLGSGEAVRWLLLVLLLLPVLAGLIRWASMGAGLPVQVLKQGLFSQVDALAYGGLLAWLRRRRPRLFEACAGLSAWYVPLLLVLMALLAGTVPLLFRQVLLPVPEGFRLWLSFGFYPMAGLLSAALLVSLWRFRYDILPLFLSRACRVLSRCSYSVYLLHLPFASFLGGWLGDASFPLYLLGSILLGDVAWRCMERPFMRLRYVL